jgi:acyl dehydratase
MAIRFPIEAGHIIMFARALGDANPVYADESYAKASETGGVIAPPTFAQASAQFDSEYPLRPKIGKPWFGSGKAPSGLAMTETKGAGGGLHAEQHFEYHRPVRAGDVLHATVKPGKTWEREGRRSGKLTFSELVTEYHDQAGNLVVTARSVGVRTERPVDNN